MHIKTWFIITINSLLLVVVISLSTSFYHLFEDIIEERILSQLSSIERLKRRQIEEYLHSEWFHFMENTEDSTNEFNLKDLSRLPFVIDRSGIYDLTPLSNNGNLLIGLVKVQNDSITSLKTLSGKYIQQILLERTGMGETGETYLVGQDYRLRSISRFYKTQAPFSIIAKTKSVLNTFNQILKQGIYKDYRGVWVYSVYEPLKVSNLHWAILTEMDVTEVILPLQRMKTKLLYIASGILIVALICGILFSQLVTRPLKNVTHRLLGMTKGNYEACTNKKTAFTEINDICKALNSLNKSLSGAIDFSHEIGEMKFDSDYSPQTEEDVLGNSLIKMKDKLIEYQQKLTQANTTKKRILIEGQETERKRLAQELHDGIGPLLTSLRFFVENMTISLDEKEKMKLLIDNTIAETRRMTYALMPPSLVDFGVGETLKTFVNLIRTSTNINIKLDDNLLKEQTKINDHIAISIFRISQELINNSVKHAQASKIRISMTEFEDHLSIFYFDDGRGYNETAATIGAGIINIKERVEILNGFIIFDCKPKNSVVEIEIPLSHG
ncbi:MAG: histidine kinase [Wenyingzhuangia sp.]|jgi:two-component system, NarL family, sensor kinase|uniref:sensor histidine kinase n=1 Tax=Wenyingzhuangia sp. TaxID=1964193 RepID=UPI00321B9383